MFKRIMVPIETKERSGAAIKIAYDMAELHKSEVILFNVISASGLAPGTQREERRKALEEDSYKMLYSIKRAAPNDRMKVFIDIVEGDPATKINEVAQKNHVDLIIMPKPSRAAPRRAFGEDTALKVAEITDIPLMLTA